MPSEQEVMEAIRPIEDPELHMSVVDLGLIYGVKVDEQAKRVEIEMTLTSLACPIGPQLRAAVHGAAAQMPGVEDVYVNLVFNPPWDPRTMASEDAQVELGLV